MNEAAEVEAQLKKMIQKFGYDTTVGAINQMWKDGHCKSWAAYQRLINLAHNVNNQINRSKPKKKK